MANPLEDTIVAPITAPGKAAVSVIRLSGPESWAIAARVFAPWPAKVQPRYALYGHLANGDESLATPFDTGRSFTGEQSVELSVHGSPASVQSLLQACIRAGARWAEPGEFTYRAFMNGRLDLTQAEGVRESVEALTLSQLQQANRLRSGVLLEEISQVRDDCFGALAMIEATVDFSEEIGELDRIAVSLRLTTALASLDQLITSSSQSRLIREGFTVAILGRPNVGKSSLLNAVLKSDRAIVTPIAGTTRDTLEEWLDVDGMAVRIIDTAGLRESEDVVEQIGIERSVRAAQSADLIWFVYDLSKGWTDEDQNELSRIDQPIARVGNKLDIAPARTSDIAVSASTGDGIHELFEDLRSRFGDLELSSGVNARHLPLLQQARIGIEGAIDTLSSETPEDLASVQLRDAVFALGQITGDTATEDMIQRIFRDFCIGK